MDYVRILKRSFEITWRYRVLWVFGILLALTAGGGGNGSGYQRAFSRPGGDFSSPSAGGFPHIPPQVISALIVAGLVLVCLMLIMMVASVVVRYVATTALIRLVNDHEETGEKRGVRQGLRWGWSRSALRLFLIDLLIGVPLVVGFILLLLLALAPLLLWTTDSQSAGIIGTVAAVGLLALVILVFIVVAVAASLLAHFFQRVCVLEEVGVRAAIRGGYGLVRRHLKDVIVMWLILVGLGFAWMIALILVMLVLVLVGLVLAGLPALMVGGVASLFAQGAWPWVLAAIVGLPIFVLVLTLPALFLGALWQIYGSSVWTLTYRELRARETAPEPPAPLAVAAG